MKAGWSTRPLATVAEVFTDGDWIETKDQSSRGIRLLQTGNVGESAFKDRAEKARYINEATFKRLRCTEVFPGDCLVSRLPDPVGRCCIVPDTGERMITAVDCTIIRFQSGTLLPEFFNYYAGSAAYLASVEGRTTGATRKRVSRMALGDIPVPLPPFAEQRRIVAILDEAFEGIAKARANAEKNIENARAVFDAYSDSLFDASDPKWQLRLLGELAEFRNGINFNKSSRGERVRIIGVKDFVGNVTVPFDQLAEVVIDGKLADADTVHRNDILFVRSNGSIELIGRSLLVENTPKPTTHSGFTIRARLTTDEVLPEFLHRVLRSNALRQRMISGGIGANIKSLSQGILMALPIPVPSKSIQQRISQELDELERNSKRLELIAVRKVEAIDELKKSLLHHAFAGEL